MANNKQEIKVTIARGQLGVDFESFTVPYDEEQTILDLLTHIQRDVDPTLSYRFACRVGMCGSCAMRVNGKPRWTCRTLVRKALQDGELRLEPLSNFKVVKDLVVDMEQFFDKWQEAKGRFEPSESPVQEFAPIKPDNAKRQLADEAIECINCGCCYAACDVVASNPDYLGPAALNRAWSLVNDAKDFAGPERLKAVSGDGGCQNCHTNSQCVARCPLQLNPTRSIAGLKKEVSLATLKGQI
ncbi:MAG: succinate dehydrogenase/fumarate reductase iron-sulfur subunit [Motiliproteus sp.]